MSSSTGSERLDPQRRTLLGWLVTAPLQAFGILCGSLLVSILVECIGMSLLWPDDGWHHAKRMFDFEMEQLSSHFKQSLLTPRPAASAEDFMADVSQFLLVDSGVLDRSVEIGERARDQAAHGNGFRRFFSALYGDIDEYVLAAGYTVLTFLARLAVLVFTLPLFVMSAFVGFVDGLVRRDVRRFASVYESGFVHHRAKAAVLALALLPWTLYLALPISLHPLAVLLPIALLLGIAVDYATATFKKYL